MNRTRFGEPKSIWFHGNWIKFASPADREEFVAQMSNSDKAEHKLRLDEILACAQRLGTNVQLRSLSLFYHV